MTNFTGPLFLLGLISNITALYLVFTKSGKELSEYKKLLIIFLITDLIYTVLQEILSPIFVVHKDLFIGVLPGFVQNKFFLSIYCGIVSMSFLIFASHFIFRALAISSSSFVSIRLTWMRLLVLVIIFISECCLWSYISHAFLGYESRYEASAREFYQLNNLEFPSNPQSTLIIFKGCNDEGSIDADNFRVIMFFTLIVTLTFTTIIVSSIHITRVLIKRGKSSEVWRKFHSQLFIALLVQLSIPCVLLYFPCSFYMLSPFLNLEFIHTPTYFLTILYSIYPIVDPLAIIVMISDYRRAVIRFARWMSFKIEPIGMAHNVSMTTGKTQSVTVV